MTTDVETSPASPLPPGGPPIARISARKWARAHLFYSPVGTILTLAGGAFAVWAGSRLARFVFVSAEWEIVRRNLALFMVWRFPRTELWRIWSALALAGIVVGLWAGARAGTRVRPSIPVVARRWWALVLFAAVMGTLVTTPGPIAGLAAVALLGIGGRALGTRLPARARGWAPVATVAGLVGGYQLIARAPGGDVDGWGGLQLTLYLAGMAIVLSFPLGILLALGRRSSLPAVRVVSAAYIELFRGIPLVAVLFMGYLLIGFFLPPGAARPGTITRALVGFVLFTSAYIAEIARGGLQSVPRGQIEAAHALGLSSIRTTAHVVLPQALRAVIPAVVGQFISLFKDTSLVVTIGLADLLSVAQTVTKQPDFLGRGLHAETLLFVSFIYWTGSYSMSRASQRLETRLGVGER